jgi:hypothetical protein
MIPAFRLEEVTKTLINSFKQNPTWNNRLIGIIFCRPGSDLTNSQVIPNLDHFNHRSGKNIDFFFAGYSKDLEILNQEIPDQIIVRKGKQTNWLFSIENFNQFREEMERNTNWNYSGSIDLLLCNASKHQEMDGFIDLNNIFYCDLEKMISNNIILSIERFFENIFQYADNPNEDNPVANFIVNQDINGIKKIIIKILNGLLSIFTGARLDGIKSNFIKNVAKNNK